MIDTIEHILFATDFSEDAEHALEYAFDLALKLNARLTLFHSLPEPYDFAPRAERIKEQQVKEIKEKLEDEKTTLEGRAGSKSIDISVSVRIGKTVASILQEAQKTEADLIVMSSHEKRTSSELKQLLYGDITSEVVMTSPVPVLAIPPGSSGHEINEIIFASNYQDNDIKLLKFIALLGRKFVAPVTILHVDKEATAEAEEKFNTFREKVRSSISDFDFEFNHIIEEDFAKGINTYFSGDQPALLVMGRKKRNFLQYIFSIGEAEELTFCSENPLLVIPSE